MASTLPPPPQYTSALATGATRPPVAQTPSSDQGKLTISFTLNGEVVTLDPATQEAKGYDANTTVALYLRSTKWTGTKISCNEGGCGACTVALTFDDPVTGKTVTRAINSCLRPLFSCNGMSITTNDGLGTPSNPNKIQKTLAEMNGSQCGYCSSGMSTLMYTLLETNPNLTKLEIEQSYDCNLCRCTGYRQIMKAMKSFASDSGDSSSDDEQHHLKNNCDEKSCLEVGCKRRGVFPELEDLDKHMKETEKSAKRDYKHKSPVTHKQLTGNSNLKLPHKVTINANGTVWQDCPTLADLEFWLEWYTTNGQKPMLVVAQTSLAVYPKDVMVKLNIAQVPELTTITQSSTGVNVGPAVPITDVINYLRGAAGPNSYSTNHFAQASDHLWRVASILVRNIASIGGNLFLCHAHQSDNDFFPSDVAITLMGLGATLTYKNVSTKATTTVSMTDFFTTDFKGCYATNIFIPWAASENEKYMSYKIAIRQVNSHAIVNSAMRVTVDPTTSAISGTPTIAFGGIFNKPTRMTNVETALVGTVVTDETTFQSIAQQLKTAIANPAPFGGRISYRKSVALTQFYRFFLFLQPNPVSKYESAIAPWFVRPVSKGSTAFTPDPKEYPVSIGMTKVEAIEQTTGHAKYTDDLLPGEDCLYAHLVLTEQGNCTLTGIDSTVAATMPGFKGIITAADLSTTANTWLNGPMLGLLNQTIDHAGKCVAVVVASTPQYAEEAAKKVQVSYGDDLKTNIVTVTQAIAANSFFTEQAAQMPPVVKNDAKTVIANTPASNKVSSTAEVGLQYHFHLENQTSYVVPREDVFEVHAATQGPVFIQQQVAKSLGVPMSKVVVSTKRCGGGFGGKNNNAILPATLCAVAAQRMSCPMKLVVPMHQSMQLLGSRASRVLDYTVAFESDGKLTALDANMYVAGGVNYADVGTGGGEISLNMLDNCYMYPSFYAGGKVAKMNIPATTPCRGPGWVPATALSEMIISKVAATVGKTPEDIRVKNFFKKGDTTADGMRLPYWDIPKIWDQLQQTSSYSTRVSNVATYNSSSRWIKRGIAMVPVRFAVGETGANFDSIVNIYSDGTIGITIGGSEIGQGINTKIIQVAAYKLGLTKEDLGMITVNETCTRNLSSVTNRTGGSITSELCALSVLHACETLNQRLAPFRKSGQSWSQLIGAASGSGVQLTATGWTAAPVGNPTHFNYNSTSAAVCEVELNCLSGEFEVARVDILFDCGISINPVIDIGQVQGGFVFGQGYFTQEEVKFDATTGKAHDANTWEYKPPSAYDVPLEFNVALLANTPNPVGVLSSKACGEPGVCLATGITCALQDAVSACLGKPWVCQKTPLTVPDLQQACAPSVSQFKLH